MLKHTVTQRGRVNVSCLDYAETVSVGHDGKLYMPDSLGRIWTSRDAGEGELQELAYAGGKPLGGYVYPNGDAVFADAVKVLRTQALQHSPHLSYFSLNSTC